MITGSDNRAAHLIDEVMLDFSFDCDVIEEIHEDRLTAWAIDELLPVLESVLNANDEAGTVLRIDQITIDLGDIDDVDYFGQLIQRFREKLDLELSKIRWRRQPLDVLQQADAQIVSGPHHAQIVDTPVAQQVTRLQFNLDLLRHFLRSGNMPWHINIAESNAHERLVDYILRETHGAAALKTLLIHMASTHREPLIQRLIYQYSEAYLGKILTASLSISHDELSHWLASVRSALPKTVLTPAQRITAETRLWACCFEAAFDAPATFTAYDISARQLLHKATVLQPHNERVQNGSMFPDERDSGELETLADTGHDTETGQFPAQSEPIPLVHRIADDRQEVGLHHPSATPEASRSAHLTPAQYDAAVMWLREQLFKVPVGASDTLAAHELPAVIQWLLHKTSELQLHDERMQNGSMFSDERDSGKLETLAETGHDTEIGQIPVQSEPLPLLHRIADDRQEAGLHHPSATPEASHSAHLTPAQYDAAVVWLRKQLFEAPASAPDTLAAHELPAVIQRFLRKTAELQLHDERMQNGSMLSDERDSGKLETLAETGHDTETGQFPAQPDSIPLVHRIADDRQEAGLHHPSATPEASRGAHLTPAQYDAAIAWLQKQLFEAPASAPDTLAAHELPAVIQRFLRKTAELQLHDERMQNGSMLSDERDSGKLETLAETGHDTETGQFPAQPDSIPLVHRIADDRQEAGLHHPSATPEASRGAHLTPAQYDAAVVWLRKQLFEVPVGASDILTAPELPAAVRQLLCKAMALQPYDENVLNGRLFQEVSRSGKPETPAVTPRDTGTGQTPVQSGMMPLFYCFVEALQKAGLLDTDLAPEKTGFTDPKDIRQRVLEILRHAMRNVQWLARLPESVLIDMIYLLSPQMAIVLEQLLLHAEIFCRHPVRKEPANRAEWKQQLWRNVLRYCAALPDSEIALDSPDSIRWIRSIAHHLSYDMAGDALLQSWHTALSGRRGSIAGINTVLNMLDVSIRPAEITQHVFAAVQEKRRFIAVIVQRVLSAVRRAGWAGADAIFDDSDASIMNVMSTVRQQLHALFRDETVCTALTSRLSSAAMNDIVYLLSPGNAVVLEQFAQRIGTTDTQSAHARHADSEQLRRLLYSNALNILVARKIVDSDAASVEIMPAHDFMTSLVHTMSATQDDKVLAALWQESLKQVDMLPEQESACAPAVLKSLLSESGVTGVSAYPAAQAGQEIRHITAAMATDFAAQKQWLQTMFNDDKRVMAQLSVPELENLVYAMLTHNPELTGADRRTLSAAIARFAEKTRNQSVYYSRILENLLFDRLIDLESIAGQTTYAGGIDADIPESVKPPVKEKLKQSVVSSETYAAVIFRRVLLSLRQAGMVVVAGSLQAALATFDMYAIRQWLTEILQVVSVRTQLIEQLPQSVLLDIVQLISPHAALYLEQVLLQTDVSGYPVAGKHRTRTGSAGWRRQIWENALRFLAARVDNDVFDARVFIQALIPPLSGNTEFTAVLLKSGRDPEKENDSLQLRKKENWSTLVQYLIAEAIAAAETAQPAISASESIRPAMPVRHDVQQILAALETDFEKQRQYLNTLHDTGRLHIDQLSDGDIKAMIQALLVHNPESMGEEHEPFVTAMETYARGASNHAMYYQRILTALLSSLDIDLEAIALNARPVQTADAPMPVQLEDEAELLYTNAGAVVLQRILSAIERLNAKAGSAESDLLLRNLQTKHLATFREQLVIGLRNPHLRTQYIAGLPQPVLLDMAFILSPAAAAMIEQVLTQSAVLQRSTAKQQDAGVKFWKLKLWEAALGFLTKLSISGSWIAGFDGAEFLQALIAELAGGEPLGAMLRHWIDALAQIPGTRVLQHLLNDLLSHRSIRRDVAGNAETGAVVSFAEAYGRSGQTSAGSPVMMGFACQPGEEFYIDNAGQVLAAPYLPRLFSLLGLMDADVFIDRTAAERAVHLLQFMVNAKNESPEYQLLLNKILCGLTPGIPIQSRIVLSSHEHDTIEGLMRGMIQNWKTIGNTSISGLRETFLQRRGRLILQEEIWFLTVEPGPFDMLLDNLPWSFSVIKHRWMERAIHVTWR